MDGSPSSGELFIVVRRPCNGPKFLSISEGSEPFRAYDSIPWELSPRREGSPLEVNKQHSMRFAALVAPIYHHRCVKKKCQEKIAQLTDAKEPRRGKRKRFETCVQAISSVSLVC